MLYTVVMNRNRDFQLCYRKGVCIPSRLVVMYARPNRLPYDRLGITAGKKIGGAVVRSRARRLIRQAWRENECDAPIGLDLVIVARHALPEAGADKLSRYLRKEGIPALRKAFGGDRSCSERS